MNEVFKQFMSMYGIPDDEIAVFARVACHAAEITGFSAGDFLIKLGEYYNAIYKMVEAAQQAAEKIEDIFKRLFEHWPDFSPPLSRLQKLWIAQRREAERQRERVRLKYLEWLFHFRRYKPP